MALIPLFEAKTYLRVDSSDEDVLVGVLLSSAEQLCVEVARLTQEQWKAIDALACDAEGNILPTDTDLYTEEELEHPQRHARGHPVCPWVSIRTPGGGGPPKPYTDASESPLFYSGRGGVMEIARMNERIIIEKNAVAVDKIGNHVNTWEEYFSCYTYASTYEAQESGDEVKEENRSVTFSVRYCRETAAVTSTGYRIHFHGDIYNILSIDPMNYQRKEIRFVCRREART